MNKSTIDCLYCPKTILKTDPKRPKSLIDIKKKELVYTNRICDTCYDEKKICVITHTWGKDHRKYYTKEVKGLNWGVYLSEKDKLTNIISGCQKLSNIVWCWLDSVCINQDDEKEKKQEIHKMYNLYKNTGCCALYRDDFDDENAEELLEVLDKIDKVSPFGSEESRYNICYHLSFDARLSSDCEWAERYWTLNETLSPKQLFMITKSYYVDFSFILDVLSKAYKIWSKCIYDLRYFTHPNIKILLMGYGKEKYNYGQIVNMIGNRISKYEHDRVYGVMGMLNVAIKVDYRCSPDVAVNRLIVKLVKNKDWSWLGCIDSINNIQGHSLEPSNKVNKSILIKNHDMIEINKIKLQKYGVVDNIIPNISDDNILRSALIMVSAIMQAFNGTSHKANVYINNELYAIYFTECSKYIKVINGYLYKTILHDNMEEIPKSVIQELENKISKPVWHLIKLGNQLCNFNPFLVLTTSNYLYIGAGKINEQDDIYATSIISEHGRMLMVAKLYNDLYTVRRKGWLLSDFDPKGPFKTFRVY